MIQGDVMKLKRWHLYVVVTLCFCIAFISINRKYDEFYRVNGINNDNRALIEMYLDDEEQEYLIENAIAVNEFIKYIEIPDFNLMNYEFYNALDKTNKYPDLNNLISVGNQTYIIIISNERKTYSFSVIFVANCSKELLCCFYIKIFWLLRFYSIGKC